MDLVYICGPQAGEELRYSLRSLANLPHDQVWIAGHKPEWCTGVQHIPTVQDSTKHHNAERNLRAALHHPGISREFVYMNDDFMVMRPIESVPTLHYGPMADVIAWYRRRFGSRYLRAMTGTRKLLQDMGYPDPLSYDLHVPMVMDRRELLQILDIGAVVPRVQYRTLYGNLLGIGGTQTVDCKVYSRTDPGGDGIFLSTSDDTWQGLVGERIRAAFPDPSPYEH